MLADSVYIGLGSNIGNRTAHLCAGLDGLRASGLSIPRISSFYLTEPVLGAPDDRGHPWYVNCVAAVRGAGDPATLLAACLDVEERHGRHRAPAATRPARGGDDGAAAPLPRALDLDVLLFGAAVIDEPDLCVPHPRMHERRFVLEPLSEIAPAALHPVRNATVAEMLIELPRGERVWLLAPFRAGAA